MNSPKQNKIEWLLDNKLNLTKNKIDIDTQFSQFNTKNSPMYNDAVSPLYTKTETFKNRVVYNTNGDRFHYEDGVLYMNGQSIMETDGDGYFIREETDRADYDTYDIDDEGNEVWSKYNQGVVKYHTSQGDYEYKCTDPLAAVIDSRARIVNGTPIIAYVFQLSSDQYEFVYLKNEVQYFKTGVGHLYKSSLKMTQVTQASPVQARNKAANNIKVIEEDTQGYIKFKNCLIQISNPLENVFCVSFISDHGSKLKPSEVGFFNILDNNGTYYNTLNWDTKDVLVEDSDSYQTTIDFKADVSHSLTDLQVYTYIIPSGNPDWDALHSKDVGKWFLKSSSDGVNEFLVNEIQFDPGYDPKTDPDGGWQQNVTDYYQVTGSSGIPESVSYTKWSIYKANTYKDVWTLKATAQPITKTNTTLDLSYDYTPVVKTIHTGEVSETFTIKGEEIIEAINSTLPEGTEFNNFEYQINADSTTKNAKVYGLNLEGLPAEENEVETIDEKWKYTAQDGTSTNANTAACVLIEKNIIELQYTTVQYTISVLFRAKTGTKVDTVPSVFRFLWIDPDEHNQQILDNNDFPTYRFTTVNSFKDSDNNTVNLNYKDFLYYKTRSSTTAYSNPVYNSEGYSATIHRSDYITWADDEQQTFTQTLQTSETPQTFEWTYEYTGNNIEYPAEHFFGKFNDNVKIKFKTTAGSGEYAYDFEDEDQSSVVSYENNFETNWSKLWKWNFQRLVKQSVSPDIILDDGTAVTLCDLIKFGTLATGATLVLHAQPTAINDNTLEFSIIGYYNSLNLDVPGVVWDVSIDLNSNYFRYMVTLSNQYGTSSAAQNSTSFSEFKWLYDSGVKTVILEPGSLTPDTTKTGVNSSHYNNVQGSLANLYNKWRSVINNNGLVSGISYGENDYIGSLLTDWNSISEDFYVYFTKDLIGYHSTDGNWYEIKYLQGDGDINIIFDRYIIVNTNGFWNCYDIERRKPLHYATDFNNRVMPGVSYKDFGEEGAYSFMLTQEYSYETSTYFVSGINGLYEVSQTAITSVQLSPQAYMDIITGHETFIQCKQPSKYQPQYIEVFVGMTTDSTEATYSYSTILYETARITVKDSSLIDLGAPVAIAATVQYSPNMFTEFIHTYNNKDLIKNGAYAYPIVYNETTPILSYMSGKQISGVDNIFVIQSQFYGIINNKIVSITYDNYSIIGTDAIIDVTGMIYLGYLPTMAFFWSPADRCIYTFTGDANLDIANEASKISQIYKTYYNPATESIFITTDIGVLIISGKQQWLIETINVDDIYFTKKGYFIITSINENKEYESISYSYEPELNNGEKRQIVLESKFTGPGAGKIATTDNVQIILITDVDEAGEVQFSCETFTDVGFKSESKTIKIDKGTWDKGNKAIVCNFFPKYQTGQGFKWKIVSDFAIASVVQSVTEKTGATLTQKNI